jgi:hypothetical protein
MLAVPILVPGAPARRALRTHPRAGAVALLVRAGPAIGHEFRVRDDVDRRIQLMQTAPARPALDPRLTERPRDTPTWASPPPASIDGTSGQVGGVMPAPMGLKVLPSPDCPAGGPPGEGYRATRY